MVHHNLFFFFIYQHPATSSMNFARGARKIFHEFELLLRRSAAKVKTLWVA